MEKEKLNNAIKSAFGSLCKNDDTKRKIEWIATSGFAFERWIQFELGFHLNEILKEQGYYIYPEVYRHDLPIFSLDEVKRAEGWIWNKNVSPEAAIELKIIGNWYVVEQDIEKKVMDDINKIANNNYDGIVLLFCVFAIPKDNEPLLGWHRQQDKNRITDYNEFIDKIKKIIKIKPIIDKKEDMPSQDSFEELNLTLLGWDKK